MIWTVGSLTGFLGRAHGLHIAVYRTAIASPPSTMAPSSSLQLLRDRLGLSGQAGVWKFLAILFALLNLKNLPFAWHVSPPNPSLYSILADLLPDPPSQRPLHPHPLLPRPHCLQTRPCRPLSTHDHFFTLWLSRMRL